MPTRLRLVLLALLATGASPVLPASQGPASQGDRIDAPLTLAVARRDGILIPFASWNGKKWANAWPVPEKRADTPITTADIPKRWWSGGSPIEAWHVWQVDGTRTETLVKRPTWYLAHCQQGIGLASDLEVRGPLPPPVVQPYPKMGLAASIPLKFSPIAVMSAESPVWKAVPAAIRDQFSAEENAQVKRLLASGGWRHPNDEGKRASIDIQVESLYRAPLGEGRFLYYFEAVKRYTEIPRPRERADDAPSGESRRRGSDCELITFANGWFVAGNTDTRVSVPSMTVRITSCDFADVDVMLPLGYVQGTDGPVWIAQLSGWGRESFALIAWNKAQAAPTVLFATPGGECPRVG